MVTELNTFPPKLITGHWNLIVTENINQLYFDGNDNNIYNHVNQNSNQKTLKIIIFNTFTLLHADHIFFSKLK